MKQLQGDIRTKGDAPSLESACRLTLAAVPTYFACCYSAVILTLLMEGRLKQPFSEALIEIGILWLVPIFAWMAALRRLSQDCWFKDSHRFTWFGLATFILTAPVYQLTQAWARAAASGVPLKFNIDVAITTAPFWGLFYYCMVLLAASWSAVLRRNLRQSRDHC